MNLSNWTRVLPNVLIEYINDTSNVFSEAWAVIYDNRSNKKRFVSTIQKTNNYINTVTTELSKYETNIISNQLFVLDEVYEQWAKYTDDLSFIQRVDHAEGFPIQYDRIRLYFPINYTFTDILGIHLRITVMDNNGTDIELTSYFYDMTNPSQLQELNYMTPFDMDGMPWGKYIEVQIPSPSTLYRQVKNGIIKENSMNHILTDGIGVSSTSPLFVEVREILNSNKINGKDYYKLSSSYNTTYPIKIDRELGLTIEQSNQGEFFNIFPTYNGSIGGFLLFINESISNGNRYYVEFTINVFEKNIKTYTQKNLIINNFTQKIEFRPILRYTNTTAIIEVHMKLIDSINETSIERFGSYGLLQEDVHTFSNNLTKLNFKKIRKTEVNFLKSNNTIGQIDNSINEMVIDKKIYTITAKGYNITTNSDLIKLNSITFIPNNKLTLYIYPFDNIFTFNILDNNKTQYNLLRYSEVYLVFRNESYNIEIRNWVDSPLNNLEQGNIVFKLKEDRYLELKTMYEKGNTSYYLIGVNENDKELIYSGRYIPWDSHDNFNRMNTLFRDSQSNRKRLINKPQPIRPERIMGGNSIGLNLVDKLNIVFKPYWNSPFDIFEWAWVKKKGDSKYKTPIDFMKFAIKIRDLGFIDKVNLDLSNGDMTEETRRLVSLFLGYCKIHSFDPLDEEILGVLLNNKSDVDKWMYGDIGLETNKALGYDSLDAGINIPPNQEAIDLIRLIKK